MRRRFFQASGMSGALPDSIKKIESRTNLISETSSRLYASSHSMEKTIVRFIQWLTVIPWLFFCAQNS
ncbi:MAG: hypothetical protein ABJC04_13740, partial [Verrucomicrobiota bacterium]